MEWQRLIGPSSVYLVGILIFLSGCNKVDEQTRARQKLLLERSEISQYDVAVQALSSQRSLWISAMEGVNRQSSPDSVRRFTQKTLLPALTNYVNALKKITTANERLDPVHQSLVTAHRKLLQAYTRFSKQLSPKNYAALREPLATALSHFNAAQGRYRHELNKVCNALGMTLLKDGTSPQAGQATEH